MCVRVFVSTCVYLCARVYVCVREHVYACVCVHMCVYMYVHYVVCVHGHACVLRVCPCEQVEA